MVLKKPYNKEAYANFVESSNGEEAIIMYRLLMLLFDDIQNVL